MFSQPIVCSRRKTLYLVLIPLALVLCLPVSYAQENGEIRWREFNAKRSNNTLYGILKSYYMYLHPPPSGIPPYDTWPVKTQRHQSAVPFLQLKCPDFTWDEAQDVTRYAEAVCYWLHGKMILPPSAATNCASFALGVSGYWVNSLWEYMDSERGDYEQLCCQPYTEATHTTHGGGPGDFAHLSKIWVPRRHFWHENWEYWGKWGEWGVYRTSLYDIQRNYGDAWDEFWRLRP